MLTKHFINSDVDLVADALESLTYQHPGLVLDRSNKTIYSTTHDAETNVALVSGGGAGHEPAHATYVGPGMLSAAVSGNIFASPGVTQIYNCIRKVCGPARTILIVKNYTGDLFHFHQAAEKARAELDLRVEVVVVGDDVSLERTKTKKVGRRGLAGTALMHKILGAMVMAQKSMDDCLAMAKVVNSGLATIGSSLDHVHIPGQPPKTHHALKPDQVEIGMGIHNEPGVHRRAHEESPNNLIDEMLRYLLDQSLQEFNYVEFTPEDDVMLVVNNLGSLSVLELSAVTTKVIKKLENLGYNPVRTYSGTFMTSLNGPGFSITLLRVNDEILSYLDAPTSTVGWPAVFVPAQEREKMVQGKKEFSQVCDSKVSENSTLDESKTKVDANAIHRAVSGACESALAAVPAITEYDLVVGDGDCGLTLERGCRAVLEILNSDKLSQSTSLLDYVLGIAHAVETSMDGTSGAIYGLFFNGLASKVRQMNPTEMGIVEWSTAVRGALDTVQNVTPARSGDRTMMDALEPFVQYLENGLKDAVLAADKGAEKTKGLKPAFGRAVYVNEEGWEQVPDPGAISVVALLEGLERGLRN